ncbi:MAG: OmpA family protein [Candidatus Binataceae bacterium]
MKRIRIYVLGLAALAMVSGCGMTAEQRSSTLEGAAIGAAIGGGIGAGVFAADNSDNWPGIPVGIGAGALAGAIIGYLMAPPTPAPPPPPPPPLPPPPPPPVAQRIILRGVHFNFDKAIIRPVDKPVLDEAAQVLKQHPDMTVNVDGYCDAIGGYAYNLKLSRRRADAVTRYLEGQGVQSNRLIPRGYGKTHFVATNSTAEGRAQNRRVELVPVQ